MEKEIKNIDDSQFLKDIKEHYDTFKYDFSNYYFQKRIWKKEYIELFGNLPEHIENSSARKVDVYVNAVSKEVFCELPSGGKVFTTTRSNWFYYQIEYVENLNAIVIESWTIDVNDLIQRRHRFYYIDSKKRLFYCDDYNSETQEVAPKSYAKAIEFVCEGNCLQEAVDKMYQTAFDKLFPIAFFGGNHYSFIRNGWTLSSFLTQKEVSKRNGPKQQKIDELCKISLSTPQSIEYDENYNDNSWWNRHNISVVASRVNDEYAVLRWFKKDAANKKIYETARLFVSKKDVAFCRINSFGEFIYLNGKLCCHNFSAHEYLIDSDDVFKGTKLEYFQSCVNELEDDKQKVMLLWLFSYYPIAEKMWKTEEYKFVPYGFVTKNSWGKFDDHLEHYFGKVNENAKNIHKAIGINAYQASKLLDELSIQERGYYRYGVSCVRTLKRSLDINDLSFIDNNTYDALCNLINLLGRWSYYYKEDIVSLLYTNYSLKSIVRIAEDFEKILPIDGSTVTMYRDYLAMASKLNDTANFKPYFKTKEDIRKMHDAALAVYELRRDAIKVESFNRQSSKWKKWEYGKNAAFVVIAPVKPSDLAKEGLALHHCVRSYIDRVAEGRTNIMFIRKSDNLEEPFFTVEVSNAGTIEQVHGFSNRNASTEPDLEKFVAEWAKACKLNEGGYNKIR